MQIMIDTAHDKGPKLLRIAAMLAVYADDDFHIDAFRLLAASAPRPLSAPVPPPIGAPAAPPCDPLPLPADNTPPVPVEHPARHPDADKFVPPTPPDVPAGTQAELPPAAVFGGALPLDTQTGLPPVPPLSASPPALAPPVGAAPSAVSAPTVTGSGAAPVAGAAPASGERDSKGYLWDDRIHSETKKKNADGTWRFRRNLDDKVKTSVLAELNAALGGAAPAATFQPPAGVASAVPVPTPPPPVPVAPVAAVAVPVPPVPAAGSVPVPPAPGGAANVVPFPNPAAAAPPVPVPPAANVGVPNPGLPELVSSFRELIQLVNVALSKGAMTQAQLSEACAHVKVESITGLASQPALVPDMYRYMRDRNWLIAAT